MNHVTVILSTYNGRKYICTQLDSILAQKDVDVFVLIRDDGSSDGTQDILNQYQKKYKCIKWYQGSNVRPCKSFFELMRIVEPSEYYAFCDQDDYWEPTKLKVAIDKLNNINSDIPALYCSNLKIVDKDLNFCKMAHNKPYNVNNRYTALVDFFATGCSMVYNQSAANLITKHISEDCIMHDSWAFLICNFFGKVIYDFESYIQYRQHGNNVIGSSKSSWEKIKSSFTRIFYSTQQPRLQNATALINEFADKLSSEDLKEINKIVNYKKSLYNRFNLLFDFKIRGNDFNRDLRYRLMIITGKI